MYRYGDGTPFPLDENFIDTLQALVKACAAAHRALLISRAESVAHEKQIAEVANEFAELAELEAGTLDHLRGYIETGPSPVLTGVVQKLVAATKTTIAGGQELLRAKERTVQESAPPDPQSVAATALTPFFETHSIPFTSWTIAWDARSSAPTASALAQSTECAATFDLPLVGYWKEATQIGAIHPGLTAKLPSGKGNQTLEKAFLVAFERSGSDHFTAYLRDFALRPNCGWKLMWKDDLVTGVETDAGSEPTGTEFQLTIPDSTNVRTLGTALAATLAARLTDRSLREIRFPAADAPGWTLQQGVDSLLGTCSSLIANLSTRSGSPDEFILKRDLASGRREEFFVTRNEIIQGFSDLPPEAQRGFLAAGLGR